MVVPDELAPELEPPEAPVVPEPALEAPVPEPTVPPLVPVLALDERPEPEPAVVAVVPVHPAIKAQATAHEIR